MQKREIARHIHQQAGISEREAAKVLECVLELLKTTLQNGEPIAIQGFGKFTVRDKRSRPGRNLQTGEALMISARRVVTFHPSLLFTTEMNSISAERQDAVARTREKGPAEGEITRENRRSL
ncbi:MAG: integration host factor subunit alpha [Nitrospiraceae bacterium]|nr:MAG: integration host factor subunit alpha [Nitrospiraceae bacterium]